MTFSEKASDQERSIKGVKRICDRKNTELFLNIFMVLI